MFLPLAFAVDMPPISRGLAPEDSDLLSVPRTAGGGLKLRANGVLQNEVTTIGKEKSGWSTDDYSDFANEPIQNGGANRELKPVTYRPIPKKYEIPSPEPETEITVPIRAPVTPIQTQVLVQQPQPQQQLYVVQQPVQPPLRKGYYYQHYPYYSLPRQYRLRPQYGYAYPPQYQNVQYTYYHPLPYQDHYNIYRSDPRFNPAVVSACGGGCGGCGGGCSGGCNGGCGGGCGGGRNGCGDYDDESESYEEDDEEYGHRRSGESRINKQDPLEDIDLETLEKLGKPSYNTDRRGPARRRSRKYRKVRKA
ncbi:hypothetical protein V3C99_002358 [Haemonchus contortus]|uniref:Chorion protein S38 n=1 Tax=Haemonchus contortus TaxID=6289 RepID=A0A7I5E8Q8_HAECO